MAAFRQLLRLKPMIFSGGPGYARLAQPLRPALPPTPALGFRTFTSGMSRARAQPNVGALRQHHHLACVEEATSHHRMSGQELFWTLISTNKWCYRLFMLTVDVVFVGLPCYSMLRHAIYKPKSADDDSCLVPLQRS